MKLLGQVVKGVLIAALTAVILAGAIAVTLPAVMHP